jgi:hypothetical protein
LKKVVPLFKSIHEPADSKVGFLISLSVGHTQRFTDVEASMIACHLEIAGFTKGKGSIGSPSRDINIKSKFKKIKTTEANEHNNGSLKHEEITPELASPSSEKSENKLVKRPVLKFSKQESPNAIGLDKVHGPGKAQIDVLPKIDEHSID